MTFSIRMGIPEMSELWNDLTIRARNHTLSADELRHYKKLGKALALLADNPRHNSLESHEITSLTERFGIKVFQSYLENKRPAADDSSGYMVPAKRRSLFSVWNPIPKIRSQKVTTE